MEQPITLPVATDEDQGVYGPPNTEALLALLQSWDDDDPEEQRETLLYLQRVLDEDRQPDAFSISTELVAHQVA